MNLGLSPRFAFSDASPGLLPSSPRLVALGALLLLLFGILMLCRRLSTYSRRPAVIWGVGGYYLSLLTVLIYGLASSPYFETAFGQLTLLTFPLSILTDHTLEQEGFATLGGIGSNFVRYVLLYGSLDALILFVFFWVSVPPRDTHEGPHAR